MELLDVVDERGEPTGRTVVRTEAHRLGIRHRTSHVWLLRRRGGTVELLLQKRSADKDSFPGCYDISSAGHIPAGQGFVESALRELKEELGLEASPGELHLCGQRRFTLEHTFHGRLFRDDQVSNVYALWWDGEAESLRLQRSEIQSVRWMTLDDCRRMVRTGTPANCVFEEELDMLEGYLAR
ncbi:MAG: NUDIX domain-containing protein [Gemmiger sp.]